jgi:hypothetical protein
MNGPAKTAGPPLTPLRLAAPGLATRRFVEAQGMVCSKNDKSNKEESQKSTKKST